MNTYKKYEFEFKPGTVNGKPKHFVHVYLKDAVFSTVEYGWFCPYAFKFKYPDWKDIPLGLKQAIHTAYLAAFNPERKEIGV